MISIIRRFLCCCVCKHSNEADPLERLCKTNTTRWLVPFHRAKIIDVYDGDTVTLAAYVEGTAFKFRCRLAHIDAPEIRPDPLISRCRREAEQKMAQLSKLALTQMALGKLVTLTNVKNEKWGRVLADLTVEGTSTTLSDRMLACGMAVPYEGGTKTQVNWRKMLQNASK